MGKLSKKTICRALVEAKDIPKEWVISDYGAPYYELHLRMSRIQELEYDFVWGADRYCFFLLLRLLLPSSQPLLQLFILFIVVVVTCYY